MNDNIENSTNDVSDAQKVKPAVLIGVTWGLLVISYFIYNFILALLISAAILVCAILLIRKKSRASKVNGIIITTIWGLTFLYGFVAAAISSF